AGGLRLADAGRLGGPLVRRHRRAVVAGADLPLARLRDRAVLPDGPRGPPQAPVLAAPRPRRLRRGARPPGRRRDGPHRGRVGVHGHRGAATERLTGAAPPEAGYTDDVTTSHRLAPLGSARWAGAAAG